MIKDWGTERHYDANIGGYVNEIDVKSMEHKMYISLSTMYGSAILCYNFETDFLHKNSTPFIYLIKPNFVNALRDTWKS